MNYRYTQRHGGGGKDSRQPYPLPRVYRLASERRYADIPSSVEANPSDIYWADRYGCNALHVLCSSLHVGEPLLRAVEAIVKVDPSLVGFPNASSWTPLHLACDRKLLWRSGLPIQELVLLLVRAFPDAIDVPLQNNYKAKTPFVLSCENNADEPVLRAMLRVRPSLALPSPAPGARANPYAVDNPPTILWNAITKDGEPTANDYSKMELLLRAAFWGSVDVGSEEDTFPMITAVCTIPCPRQYAVWALQTYDTQIEQPDDVGLWPLHHAISSAKNLSPWYTNFIIRQLLEEYPEAASVPYPSGRLPLQEVLADGSLTWQHDALDDLVCAWPEALRIPDPLCHLVPSLQSAEVAHESLWHLTTTYELLRLAPEVVQPGYSTLEAP